MNFLAPLFLAGAAAVALPIFFHLIRRTTRDRLPFSTLRFLLPSPPRMDRRSRLDNLLLLLLRCAALVLLAAGFARPFLRGDAPVAPPASSVRRIAVLVDTSASMRRPGAWEDARAKAASELRQARPDDEFAIFTFDRSATPRFSFEEWSRTAAGERAALALARLDSLNPTWSATHLGDALVAAAESLQDQGDSHFAGRKEIVLVSDLQEGARLDRVQGYDWPKDVTLRILAAKPTRTGNAGLQIVADPHGTVASTSAVVRVRVSNAPDSTREQFSVTWAVGATDTPVGTAQDIYVPPGQSRTVSLPAPTNAAPDRIVLRGDDEPFDNRVFVFPPEPVRVPVVFFGEDTQADPKSPLFFLRRALPTTPGLVAQVIVAAPSSTPVPGVLESATLVVATDALAAPVVESLRTVVATGKTLLFAPRRVDDLATLSALLRTPPWTAEEHKPSTYAMLGDVDFRHPLLAPFADPRFSDFSRIHFWRYRRIDTRSAPDAKIIARFDSGDPAWVEIPLEKGRVLLFASGWNPDDSQLALSTKFVPLLFSMIESGGSTLRPSAMVRHVDSPIPILASESSSSTVGVRLPSGDAIAMAPGAESFAETRIPGIYEIGGGSTVRRVAVNLDPSESLTAPRNPDDLERVGAPVDDPTAKPAVSPARAAQLAAAEAENLQKLWRWFLVATLLVLVTETAVAGWTLRRRSLTGEFAS